MSNKKGLGSIVSLLEVQPNKKNFKKFIKNAGKLLETDRELRLFAEKARIVLGKDKTETRKFLFDYFVEKGEVYPAICCAEMIGKGKIDRAISDKYQELISVYDRRKKKELDQIEESFTVNKPDVDVSVIMPTYNRSQRIKPSIESVLNQTFKNFELIIVNDGGTKDCEEVINSYKTDRIRYLYIEHRGLSGALNHGILASRSKYITYLDDDDLYLPFHLETVVNAMETSGLSFVYTDCYRVNLKMEKGQLKELSRTVPFSMDFDPGRLTEMNYIPILCIAHRRDCLKEIGLFAIGLPNLMDWDLWVRCSRKFDFFHVKNVTCEYNSIVHQGSLSSNRIRHGFYYILLRKHHEFQAEERCKEILTGEGKQKVKFGEAEKVLNRYIYNPYKKAIWLVPLAVKEKRWSKANFILREMARTQPIHRVLSVSFRFLFKTSVKTVFFSVSVIFFGLIVRFFGFFWKKKNFTSSEADTR